MQNAIFFSNTTDPHYNLAFEELLYAEQGPGVTLYLWQNQNTVVIGKNQNAWKECRASLLEQEGGKLARRSSGGGAVFHDLGNLNFTFIMPRARYDVRRQLSVVQEAVRSFGIETEFTGRNDLVVTASGAKFSGNAFMLGDKIALHHGTILLDVDMQKLTRYLAPPPDKLVAKGIGSVRARVQNLRELAPELTIECMQRALIDAFIKEYGPARVGQPSSMDPQKLQDGVTRHESWEWCMGATPRFDIALETRFAFGGVDMQLCLQRGYIVEAHVYSDAMDEAFIERLAPALTGCAFRSADVAAAIRALGGGLAEEIAGWIEEKGF